MYPSIGLYNLYKKHIEEKDFSSAIPDVTKKRTLELMQVAVRCAEDWNNALDIGGGSGHYSIPLSQVFKQVTLVEPDEHEDHEILEDRFPNLSIVHEFVENVVIPEKQDLILLSDIYEHIPNIEAFIAKLSTLQEKGGVIYILTPNPVSCGPAIRSAISYTISGSHGHIRHYFKNEVEEVLAKHGYYLVHHSFEETPLRTPLRIMLRGLSRRDKRWNKRIPYRIVRPLVLVILAPIVSIIQSVAYRTEYAHRDDAEHTRSSVYIFKKL